jgi:NADH-quinone oxidoreductase subunit E
LLTPEEQEEIERAQADYPVKSSVAIDALKIVQRHRGWISDEALEAVAGAVGMSTADLDGVATFYNHLYRKPVGRHVILLCDSVSCWIMGYTAIRDALFKRLGIRFGETTPDGRFTLLPVVCLGDCDRAPAMMIDDKLHDGLTAAALDAILDGYR